MDDLKNQLDTANKLSTMRLKANLELVEVLKVLVDMHGRDLRFSQILANFGFVKNELYKFVNPAWLDEYDLEPNVLLERVKKEYSKVFE